MNTGIKSPFKFKSEIQWHWFILYVWISINQSCQFIFIPLFKDSSYLIKYIEYIYYISIWLRRIVNSVITTWFKDKQLQKKKISLFKLLNRDQFSHFLYEQVKN